MNTDNTSISGETLDYGPCAFLEGYDPETVFSSIDHAGRYGYGNQPGAALWNLMRLAECLLPLLDMRMRTKAMDTAKGALEGYGPEYERARAEGLARKVGVAGQAGAALGGGSADADGSKRSRLHALFSAAYVRCGGRSGG